MLLAISGHRELHASGSFRLQIARLLPRQGTPLHLAVYVLLTACRVAGVQTCDSRQPSAVRFFAGVHPELTCGVKRRLTHVSAEPPPLPPLPKEQDQLLPASPFLLPAWKLNAPAVVVGIRIFVKVLYA